VRAVRLLSELLRFLLSLPFLPSLTAAIVFAIVPLRGEAGTGFLPFPPFQDRQRRTASGGPRTRQSYSSLMARWLLLRSSRRPDSAPCDAQVPRCPLQ
jgi:hypothetical protein